MTSSQEPVEPVGEPAAPAAGPPPRRVSLLDVPFTFVEGAPPSVAGLTAEPTAEPTADAGSMVAAAFVTETMAELYRAQGLPERALEIYRTLLARDPGRPALLERIRELEQATPHLAALSFDDVRLPTGNDSDSAPGEPTARAVLRALGARRVEGSIAHDLGAAAAAIGDAPWQASGPRDDAFADWT